MFRTICLGPSAELERTWISSIPPWPSGTILSDPRVQAHHVPSFMFAGCHLTSLPPMEG
jgi:hypothetical protein